MRARLVVLLALSASACDHDKPPPPIAATADAAPSAVADASVDAGKTVSGPPRFKDDMVFLSAHGMMSIVLARPDGAVIAVSPKYQGRVMTSAVTRSSPSFGWINRAFVEAGKTGTQFDNYGGEDRFWLGPEGGQYGLYFPPGKPFTFDNWQVPSSMQEGEWKLVDQSDSTAVLKGSMTVTNWSGTVFTLDVDRTITMVTKVETAKYLGVETPANVRSVAFQTKNTITNTGKAAWTAASGLPSIWILAMFTPAEDGRVVIPVATTDGGKPAINDAYFGKVPDDRLALHDGFLTFRVDGKYRSKIGLGPAVAKNVLGSYSPGQKLLTIVQYEKPTGTKPQYVNSMWEKQKDPYAGDVVNSYNDGPPAPGKPPLGGFYEIETSSPALALAPTKSATHIQRTYHFVGEPADLEPIAKAALGVSLADITK